MGKAANGSTLNFGGAVANLKSLSFSRDQNAIDVTVLADTQHVFETGIPSNECVAEISGIASNDAGDTGALTLTWNDGSATDTLASALCISAEASGDLDGEIITTLTFVPADS